MRNLIYGFKYVLLAILMFSIPLLFLILPSRLSSEKTVIKVGGLFSLTGAGASYGLNELNGLELAISEFNSQSDFYEVILDYRDIATDPELAKVELLNLKNQNINLIFGPTWGEIAEALLPIASENNILLISSSGGLPLKAYREAALFCNAQPDQSEEVQVVIRDLASKKYNNVVVIHNPSSWSKSMADVFKAQALGRGINVVKTISISDTDSDFSQILTQIKDLKFDALYLPFADRSLIGDFLMQLLKHNSSLQQIPAYSVVGVEMQSLIDSHATYLENLIYPYPLLPENYYAFEKAFNLKFHQNPDFATALWSYESFRVFGNYLNTTKLKTLNVSKVKDYFISSPNGNSYNTATKYNSNCWLEPSNYILKTIKNGKFVNYE